jgi:hypothetical protein
VFKQWVKSRTAKTTTMGSELERYLRLEPQETEDPIEWWMARQAQFPMVSQLALDILAIPAMATDRERSFSLAKLTLTSQRLSMTSETLEKFSVSINQVKQNLDSLLDLVDGTPLLDLVYSVRVACFAWLVDVTRLLSIPLRAPCRRSMLTYRFEAGAFDIQSPLQCPN